MKKNKLDITSRVVMVEKKPFYVNTMTPTYNGMKLDFVNKILVRPCVSEDDLSTARSEYRELEKRFGKRENNISFNPMEYYLVLDRNNVYIGNIVNKNVCRRINNKNNETNRRIIRLNQ